MGRRKNHRFWISGKTELLGSLFTHWLQNASRHKPPNQLNHHTPTEGWYQKTTRKTLLQYIYTALSAKKSKNTKENPLMYPFTKPYIQQLTKIYSTSLFTKFYLLILYYITPVHITNKNKFLNQCLLKKNPRKPIIKNKNSIMRSNLRRTAEASLDAMMQGRRRLSRVQLPDINRKILCCKT